MIEVKVWGETIRLSTRQDIDFVNSVAEYLNQKMDEVYKDRTLNTTKIAALRAAFLIAAENMHLQTELENDLTKLEKLLEEFKE